MAPTSARAWARYPQPSSSRQAQVLIASRGAGGSARRRGRGAGAPAGLLWRRNSVPSLRERGPEQEADGARPARASECREAGSASEEEEQGVRARRARRAGSLRGRRVGGGDGRGGGRGLGLFLGASPVLAAAALAPRRRLTSDLAGNSACLRASAPRRSPERGWSRRRHAAHHLSGRPARPSLRLAHSLRAADGPARPPPAPSSPPACSRHRRGGHKGRCGQSEAFHEDGEWGSPLPVGVSGSRWRSKWICF